MTWQEKYPESELEREVIRCYLQIEPFDTPVQAVILALIGKIEHLEAEIKILMQTGEH